MKSRSRDGLAAKGLFEQKFSKNSNVRGLLGGDVEASIWLVHNLENSRKDFFRDYRKLMSALKTELTAELSYSTSATVGW